MSNPNENGSDFKPEIPPAVRTTVYFTGLAVGFIVVMIVPIAGIWAPEHSVGIIATATAVSAAFGWLSSALGVAYRPTGHEPANGYTGRYAAEELN